MEKGPKLTPRLIAVDIKGHLDFPDQTKEFPLHVPNVDHELDQCQGLPCKKIASSLSNKLEILLLAT